MDNRVATVLDHVMKNKIGVLVVEKQPGDGFLTNLTREVQNHLGEIRRCTGDSAGPTMLIGFDLLMERFNMPPYLKDGQLVVPCHPKTRWIIAEVDERDRQQALDLLAKHQHDRAVLIATKWANQSL